MGRQAGTPDPTASPEARRNAGSDGDRFGYHVCYFSPADEHKVQLKDAGIRAGIAGATTAGVRRRLIQFSHLPVPNPGLTMPASRRLKPAA
jgi:hypothetical protein